MSLKLAQKTENICRSRKILLEMLHTRGYDIKSYESYTNSDLTLLFNQHNQKVAISNDLGPLDILVKRKNGDKEEKLLVKYKLDEKFKKNRSLEQQIMSIFETHLSKDDCLIILNYDAVGFKPTKKESNIESFIDRYYNEYGYFVQIYGLRNFLFNVSKHMSVPKHEVISKKETDEILLKFNIKLDNLENIRREDPNAKFIGLKPGQVCKITRPSESSINSIIYRRCID